MLRHSEPFKQLLRLYNHLAEAKRAKINSERLKKLLFAASATDKRIWLSLVSLFVPLPLPAPGSAPVPGASTKRYFIVRVGALVIKHKGLA